MPFLTPQQRSQVVAKAGLDPLLYDYDEDSAQWITKVPQAPIAPPEGPSNLESFGRGAAQSVIPTATGALGAVGLLGLAGSGIGTPAAIALALTGGLGGGYIGAKTQSAILPDEFQARFFPREADITENPLATAAGGLAGSLPTFRPSVSALKTLGGASIKGLQNTLRPGAISLSMPEKAALVNTAVQGGIGGAVSVAEDLRLGHEINPTKAVLEAAGNVLFNKPTRFGQALGLTDVAPNTSRSIDLAKLEPTSEASMLTAGPKQTLTRDQPKLTPSVVDKNILGRPSGKAAEASAKAFTGQAISSRDKLVASRIRRPKPPEFNDKELIPGEYNPSKEADPNLQDFAKTRQLIRDELDKRGITPTDERFNTLFKDLSQRFGLKPVIDATLQGPDGSAVAGKMIQDIFDRYLVAIRPAKDRVTLGRPEGDTGPHEVLHAAIEQMRTSPNPGTRRYIARLESQISKSPEYLAMKARHPELTPNEWLTQRGGLDYIRRTLKTRNPLSQVFDDVTSIIKERIGKATPEDLGRLMSRHLDYSPPIDFKAMEDAFKRGDIGAFRAFGGQESIRLTVNGTTEQEAGLIDDIVKKYEGKDTTLRNIDNDLKSAGITDAKYRAALTQAIVDKLPKQPTAFQRGETGDEVPKTPDEIKPEEQSSNEFNQPAESQASDYVTRLAAKSSELDIRRTAVDKRIGEVEQELSAIPIEDVNRRGALLLQLDNLHTENMALAESHSIIQKQLGLIETGTLDQFERNQPAEWGGDLGPVENPIVERFEQGARDRARDIISEAQGLIKSGASLNSRRLVDLQNEIEGLGEIQAKLNGIIPPEELNQPADFNGVDTSRDATFYQPATANTLQPVAVSKPHFFGGLSFIRPLASAVDKLRLKSWESVGAARSSFLNVANAVKNWDAWQSALQGRLINEPLDTLFKSKVPKSEYPKALRAYETYAQTGKRPVDLPQQVNDVFNQIDIFARRIRSLQRAVGMPTLGLKNRVVDTPETFAPFVLNDKALLAFTENVGSEDFFRFKKLWKNHLVKNDGITPDEANALVENYVSSLGGKEISKVEFNALRRTEGISLPEELRETDLVKVINKIGRRASQDLAYFRYFQNDFKTAAALGIPDAITGNKQRADGIEVISSDPNVRNALKFITNDFVTVTNPRITSAARAVSNSLLGFGTGLRDIAAIPALALPYMRTSDYKSFVGALKNLKDARKQSLIYNARSNQMDFNRWKTLENPDKATDIFNRFAEIMRRGQFREALEQGARIYSFALGKELAKTNTLRAMSGDSAAIDWFRKFGTLLDIKDKSSIAKLTEDDLNQVAKNFVDRHQGTYGPRGLPAGAFEGPLSPWMALSRWSIEKSNVIYKDVIRPAIDKGNYIPLLHYTLGTMLTGVAIRELNEFLSGGRSPQDASFREALAAESPEDVVAAAIITAQLGAWAGIVGDSARWMSDAFIRGETPSGLTFPLVDFFTDKLVQGMIDYRNAVEAGANPTKALFGFFAEVAKGGIQNVRLAHYWMNPSEVERKNAFRDIRTFKQLNDEPVPQLGTLRTNPLLNKDLKEFKRAETVEEAVSFLPNLIEQAVENANGDPYKLKAELRRIKQNSFQILPNPETMPISFAKMISFLEKTQGKEAAKQRLSKYFVQNIVNQQKAELIP